MESKHKITFQGQKLSYILNVLLSLLGVTIGNLCIFIGVLTLITLSDSSFFGYLIVVLLIILCLMLIVFSFQTFFFGVSLKNTVTLSLSELKFRVLVILFEAIVYLLLSGSFFYVWFSSKNQVNLVCAWTALILSLIHIFDFIYLKAYLKRAISNQAGKGTSEFKNF